MKRIIFIIVILAILGWWGFLKGTSLIGSTYAKDIKKDPFESLLPKEKEKEVGVRVEEEVIALPEVTIEGVMWDTDTPRAIINGEVYKQGDTIKDMGAEVFRIEANTVFIMYKGKVFKKRVLGKL